MNPPAFLPSITALIEHLPQLDLDTLVIADHPARLGIKPEIRDMLIHRIEEKGGKFISAHTGVSACKKKEGLR